MNRSEMMSRVRSKGNKSTELRLIEIMKKNKIKGWRRNYPIFGNPDFVFFKPKVAVFVDGCFWHGHSCKSLPKSNREYWEEKIKRNAKRDLEVSNHLQRIGWTVLRLWECELKPSVSMEAVYKLKDILKE